MKSDIERNLSLVEEKIKRVCSIYKIDRNAINLVVVSKSQSSSRILEAINCGVRIFGENYIQEAERKWISLNPDPSLERPIVPPSVAAVNSGLRFRSSRMSNTFGDVTWEESRGEPTAAKPDETLSLSNDGSELKALHTNIKLHFIGHLQTNKVRQALQLFDCIESVDSERLAVIISKMMQELLRQDKKLQREFFIQVNLGEETQKGGISPNMVGEFVKFCKYGLARKYINKINP